LLSDKPEPVQAVPNGAVDVCMCFPNLSKLEKFD